MIFQYLQLFAECSDEDEAEETKQNPFPSQKVQISKGNMFRYILNLTGSRVSLDNCERK